MVNTICPYVIFWTLNLFTTLTPMWPPLRVTTTRLRTSERDIFQQLFRAWVNNWRFNESSQHLLAQKLLTARSSGSYNKSFKVNDTVQNILLKTIQSLLSDDFWFQWGKLHHSFRYRTIFWWETGCKPCQSHTAFVHVLLFVCSTMRGELAHTTIMTNWVNIGQHEHLNKWLMLVLMHWGRSESLWHYNDYPKLYQECSLKHFEAN